MTADQILDFIESNGIQIWPVRKAKHGPVLHWYVQNVNPWLQLARPTLRQAVTDLVEKLGSGLL